MPHDNSTPSGFPTDVERVLQAKSVRDPAARALFLSAIREFGRDGGSFKLERLERLIRVEEHFQALLLYDQLEFLRAPAIVESERDFALNIQRICLEAANGFQRFLRGRNDWATTPETVDLIFRLTGLALNAIHCFVKWGYFLNEPGRTVPWKQLHTLYLLAESEGYSQAPFLLHSQQPSFRPSVQSLYLRTLVLELVCSGSLTRIQTEIADGWFSSWCGDYALDTDYSSRAHLFFVDLASDSGLHVIRKDSHGDSLRYVRAEGLKTQIDEVQAGLRHGRLYAGYGAGAVFPVEEHVALLAMIERLYASMVAGSENRIEERTAYEDREVEVVVGIDKLLDHIHRGTDAGVAGPSSTVTAEMVEISPSGLSLRPLPADSLPAAPVIADPDLQTWRIRDLSSKGYGLIVDRASADTLLLKGIVGLRNQQTRGWIVGTVVRKLANRMRGEMLAGIEVLSFRPVRVELRPGDGSGSIEALFLPGLDTNGKLDALLVRTADFHADQAYALKAGGTTYRVRMNRITNKGADWIKARFEIVSKG